MTNLEWLRTLDAEEFDLSVDSNCSRCTKYVDGECTDDTGNDCHPWRVAWLNAEHEEPDSWEKLKADIGKYVCEYWGKIDDMSRSECPHNHDEFHKCSASECWNDMCVDIVRRANRLKRAEDGQTRAGKGHVGTSAEVGR